MRIANNVMAMNTHRAYTANNDQVQTSAEKLSSGYRINRAGDDAAGLAISEKMRSQIRGLNMSTKNSQDAVSLIQTAEGALQEVHSMLQRMNELAVQSSTGTNESFDRTQIAKEFEQLKREINDISEQTTFNNMNILDGSLSANGLQRSAYTSGVYKTFETSDPTTTPGPLKNVSLTEGTKYDKQSNATFTIDLGGLKLDTNGGTVTLNVGGVSVATTVAKRDDGNYGGEEIAKLVYAKVSNSFTAGVTMGTSTNNGLDVKLDGTKLVFTVKGEGKKTIESDLKATAWSMSVDSGAASAATPSGAVAATDVGSYSVSYKASDHIEATTAKSYFEFDPKSAEIGDSFSIGNNKFIFVRNDEPMTDIEKNNIKATSDAWMAVNKSKGGNVYEIDLDQVVGTQQLADKLNEIYAKTENASNTVNHVGVSVVTTMKNNVAVNGLQIEYKGIGGTKVNSNTPVTNGAKSVTDSFGSQGTQYVKLDSTPVNKSGEGKMTFEIDMAKMKVNDVLTWKANDGKTDLTYTYKKGDTIKDVFSALGIKEDKNTTIDGNSWTVKADSDKIGENLQFKQATDFKAGTYDAMKIQVGALQDEQLSIKINSMNTAGLGLDETSIYKQADAGKAVTATRDAINQVSDQRALLGAMQNRMGHKIANLKVSVENLQASESRIRDIDIASEMTSFTKNNILAQAATAMLAQANSAPQNVLSLLR